MLRDQQNTKGNKNQLDQNIKSICNIPLNCKLEKKMEKTEKGRDADL